MINTFEQTPTGFVQINLLNKEETMTSKNLSILNQLRPVTIGFDPMFDRFEAMLNDEFFMNGSSSNYPPYNINKTGEYTYDIEVALAGFGKKDIDVGFWGDKYIGTGVQLAAVASFYPIKERYGWQLTFKPTWMKIL